MLLESQTPWQHCKVAETCRDGGIIEGSKVTMWNSLTDMAMPRDSHFEKGAVLGKEIYLFSLHSTEWKVAGFHLKENFGGIHGAFEVGSTQVFSCNSLIWKLDFWLF